MDELIKCALQQGLGYGLFVFLLIYTLKTSGEREQKYQDLLSELTEKFIVVENIQSDVKDIKSRLN